MSMSRRFQVTRQALTLDGEPFQVLSGAMHYFRTLPQQWPDRLAKLRAMGLNTVETYVPWNLHEPRPGEFTFAGLADLEGFLTAAEEAGLYAIVRPGPYICAEWENGGIPAWLEFRRRCHDPRWLEPVDRWFDELIPRIAARQVSRGGNVLMVQVENEYGSYGDDHVYLRHLAGGLARSRAGARRGARAAAGRDPRGPRPGRAVTLPAAVTTTRLRLVVKAANRTWGNLSFNEIMTR
ncbi:beta-galactosidase [Nonomuraea sp. NPDC003754]